MARKPYPSGADTTFSPRELELCALFRQELGAAPETPIQALGLGRFGSELEHTHGMQRKAVSDLIRRIIFEESPSMKAVFDKVTEIGGAPMFREVVAALVKDGMGEREACEEVNCALFSANPVVTYTFEDPAHPTRIRTLKPGEATKVSLDW